MYNGTGRVFCIVTWIAFSSAAVAQIPAADPPVSAEVRWKYLADENLGVGALLDDVAVGAINTAFNAPKEYGPHWVGFAKRTGLITGNYGVKSTMEVGLGSIWGEDPRYFRLPVGTPMKKRLGYVIASTFLARDRSGKFMPAYARYIAMPGSNFLANEWEPTSYATTNQALIRTALGFLSRMGENAYKEFIVRRKP
jgi:hypothetical protein